MARPFSSFSIERLEDEYERALTRGDQRTIAALSRELGHRSTPRAKQLRDAINEQKSGTDPKRRQTRGTAGSSPGVSKKHQPTGEQLVALQQFSGGSSLKINAFAGTGKTSTLEMLSHSTRRRGQYIAFNRAIVNEAKERFPQTVTCSTSHSLAYRAIAPRFPNNRQKLSEKFNANHLAELLKLKPWRLDEQHSLAPRSQGYLILETIRRFAQSADQEISDRHVPLHGSLAVASASTVAASKSFALRGARHVWQQMIDPDSSLPIGHDGYLKLWALSQPTIEADYIMLDEAQDTNPVVLDVLKRQSAQIIYVGDRYQQIYEWRGAVNAMEEMSADATTYLTTSFRFGPELATLASQLLQRLGERRSLNGNPKLTTRIGVQNARTILARTNATTISAVVNALDADRKPHLVGGNDELMSMLRGVADLKAGQPSVVPDFFGFANWGEVAEFARSAEGAHLLTFVNLVESRGERQLMWALGRTVEEHRCDTVISTAHKAKGREWKSVELSDDFMKPNAKRPQSPEERKRQADAELRLLYVAITRAKEGIQMPETLVRLLAGQKDAQQERGADRAASAKSPAPASAPKTSFERPKNWEPPPAPKQTTPAPKPAASAQTKRPGFWGRLFGA